MSDIYQVAIWYLSWNPVNLIPDQVASSLSAPVPLYDLETTQPWWRSSIGRLDTPGHAATSFTIVQIVHHLDKYERSTLNPMTRALWRSRMDELARSQQLWFAARDDEMRR